MYQLSTSKTLKKDMGSRFFSFSFFFFFFFFNKGIMLVHNLLACHFPENHHKENLKPKKKKTEKKETLVCIINNYVKTAK